MSTPDVFDEARRATRWYRWLLAVTAGVFAFFGVSAFVMWFSAGDGSNLVSGLVITPPSVWAMVRAARLGIVSDVDSGDIIVRGEFRTRRLAWRDIDHFSLEWSGHILPWYELKVALRDGSEFAFSPLRELRWRRGRRSQRLEHIVTELNERVRAEDQRSPAGSSRPGETT